MGFNLQVVHSAVVNSKVSQQKFGKEDKTGNHHQVARIQLSFLTQEIRGLGVQNGRLARLPTTYGPVCLSNSERCRTVCLESVTESTLPGRASHGGHGRQSEVALQLQLLITADFQLRREPSQ
jgi:hypothetical protein